MLSHGQAHESQFAQRPLDGIGVQRQNGSMKRRAHAALADKAYSGHTLRNELKNIELEISNQCGRLFSIIIIYYNSALLSRLLQKYEAVGNPWGLALLKRMSPVA